MVAWKSSKNVRARLCWKIITEAATVIVDTQPTTVIFTPLANSIFVSSHTEAQRPLSSLVQSGKSRRSGMLQMLIITDDDQHHPLPYEVDVRPAAEFDYDRALIKLSQLCSSTQNETLMRFLVPGEPPANTSPDEFGMTDTQGKLFQISAYLNLENEMSIGCVGAILCFLRRSRSAMDLPDYHDRNVSVRINQCGMFSLQGTMLACPSVRCDHG